MFEGTFMDQLLTTLIELIVTFSGFVTSSGGSSFTAAVPCGECPGSMFTSIAAAWANIAYVTHSDLLYYFNFGSIAKWAPLIYVFCGIGALISVALGSPPKQYIWFILGPACYFIAIGTTQEVHGVKWRVAGRDQDMTEVYKQAEIGLRNTDGANEEVGRPKLTISPVSGVAEKYQVSTVMLYLDELLSATAEQLIDMTGLYRQMGNQSQPKSNLAEPQQGGSAGSGGQPGEGPWYLLSNLKWGMLENIVGVSARDPDVRDAFVTFLSTECGERFKQTISSGRYIAASRAGAFANRLPLTVMRLGEEGEGASAQDFTGENIGDPNTYDPIKKTMGVESIPTPRSLIRVALNYKDEGSFGHFSRAFRGRDSNPSLFFEHGRDVEINCMEYLYTVIQALRWEAGHAYFQLLKSSPRGLNEAELLTTFTYGWNIRERKSDPRYADVPRIRAFIQQLIFVYLVRNELLYAPQITEVDQRNSPSEQAKSSANAYVRTAGSKQKFAELFQWAMLMPHLQGIIVYIIIIAYPFAVILMIIPGHWKAFFTWALFFAWIKMWDVGFAVVQVLERSVWAMIGNNDAIARAANYLIQTSAKTGTVATSCPGDNLRIEDRFLGDLCSVPDVCHVKVGSGFAQNAPKCNGAMPDQQDLEALMAFDKALSLGASIDLDLMNGYYIYIMAALYFAVPAITGQFILGAKAGMAQSLGQTFNSQAGEAGGAARTAWQQQSVQNVMANQASASAGAAMKAQRHKDLAARVIEAQNTPLDMERDASFASQRAKGLDAVSSMDANLARHRTTSNRFAQTSLGQLHETGSAIAGPLTNMIKKQVGPGAGTGAGTGATAGAKTAPSNLLDGARKAGNVVGGGLGYAVYDLPEAADNFRAAGSSAFSIAYGQDLGWDAGLLSQQASGLKTDAGRFAKAAGVDIDNAVWEARSDLGAHIVTSSGIAGMNAGNLQPGTKPTDLDGLGYNGQLGGRAKQAARYPGADFFTQTGDMYSQGKATYGSTSLLHSWNTRRADPTKLIDEGMGLFNGEKLEQGWNTVTGSSIDNAINSNRAQHDELTRATGR